LVLSNTVRANLAWSALHDKVAELRRGAGLVNTPGNDVFESRDASGELGRFDAAVLAMDRSYGDVLKQIDTFSQTLRHVENTMGLAELENTKSCRFWSTC
jgi:hypothetical protein